MALWHTCALALVVCTLASPTHLPLHRLSQPHSRRHSTVFPAPADVAMGGGVYPQAIYWSFIEVGTPPLRIPVIVDSGSPFLNVPSVGCQNCLHTSPNNAYDPAGSRTARPYTKIPSKQDQAMGIHASSNSHDPDTWKASYQTCDVKHPMDKCNMTGRLFTDKVSFGGIGPVDVVFGTIDSQSSNINPRQEVTGLVGLMPPFEGLAERQVFTQLVAAGLCEPVFSMCLHDGSSSHGTLTIGSVDSSLADGPITYVPDAGYNHTWKNHPVPLYGVRVAQLRIGNISLEYNEPVVLDSGTNIMILPDVLMDKLHPAMCSDSSLPHCDNFWKDQCFKLTDEQLNEYPQLLLDLDGITLEMSPKDYLLLGSPLATTEDQYCLGIRRGGPWFLLGDTTLRNYYVVHDLKHHRIGWGKVNRETCGSLSVDFSPSVITIFV